MEQKEYTRKGGKVSAESRLGGMTKEQKSDYMRKVRMYDKKRVALASYSGTVKGLRAILNLRKFIVCPSCKQQKNVEQMSVNECFTCEKIRYEN